MHELLRVKHTSDYLALDDKVKLKPKKAFSNEGKSRKRRATAGEKEPKK